MRPLTPLPGNLHTTMNKRLEKRVAELLKEIGEAELIAILDGIRGSSRTKVLTIVANEGLHLLPDKFRRGEIFSVTEGNFDTSSVSRLKESFETSLIQLAIKLKSANWEKIYVVPFGHVTMSMQIKLLVYRITGIDSIDLFHLGSGKYFDLSIKQRALITKVAKQ